MIRERDNWTCQRCNRVFPQGLSRQHLHCSHIFSRRHKATRWEPYNAVAHCFTCHDYLGGNPVMFDHWARNYWGNYIIDMLKEKHQQIVKLTKADKVELYAHLKSEYARMLRERDIGETGILTFTGYL